MTFDPTKPVQTRDGLPVRVICTDRKGEWPIIGLVTLRDGKEEIGIRRANGTWLYEGWTDNDFVNVKTKRSGWINIYPADERDSCGKVGTAVFRDRRHADENQHAPNRVACVRIEWEE